MSEFFGNRVFQATSVAWVAAQALKFFLELILRRRFNLRLLTTMGGMPSSHSAAVVHGAAAGEGVVDAEPALDRVLTG